MPHIESYSPQNIFNSAIKCGFLIISCSTLFLRDFIPKLKSYLNAQDNKVPDVVLQVRFEGK